MLGFYLTIGLGVSAAYTCARWSDVAAGPTLNSVVGVTLAIIAWPYALYNWFDKSSKGQ